MGITEPAVSLTNLRWWPNHHRFALAWLGLLYRDPMAFLTCLGWVDGRQRQFRANLLLFIHALPWLIIIMAVSRILLFAVAWQQFGVSAWAVPLYYNYWINLAYALAFALPLGIAVGVVAALLQRKHGGLAYKLVDGLTIAVIGTLSIGLMTYLPPKVSGIPVIALTVGLATGLGTSVAIGMFRGQPYGLVMQILYGLATGAAAWLAITTSKWADEALMGGIIFCAAFFFSNSRLYYLPVHFFFVWPKLRAGNYRLHPAAWDKMCGYGFPGLNRLLVAYAELHPEKGLAEIKRLINDYPAQRKHALWARTVLTIRAMAWVSDLAKLQDLAGRLPMGLKGYLARMDQVIEQLQPIVDHFQQLRQATDTDARTVAAENLVRAIDDFHSQASDYPEPLASEFRKAAEAWQGVADQALMEASGRLGRICEA